MTDFCAGETINPLLFGFGMVWMTLWTIPALILAYIAGWKRWRVVRTSDEDERGKHRGEE